MATNLPIVLIDPGHGADAYTNGKYSPPVAGMGIENDPTIYGGRFREGNFNRLIAKDFAKGLIAKGIDARVIVPEDADISLGERVRRVNSIANKVGSQNCILVSVHANAAGNCSAWAKARGLSVHICNNASAKSKILAKTLYDAGAARGLKGDRYVPAAHYWVDNFYMVAKTVCPAVLTENLFYDNKEDLKFLASPEGRKVIVDYLIEGVMKFIESQYR